jgi:hypothetical protein
MNDKKWLYLFKEQNLQNMTFQYNEIVDKIFSLPLEDKVELKDLLENNIADSRRAEIQQHYKKAKDEEKSGTLDFSSSIHDLKKML